jgi:NhaP-type Na+/H+ and K+/H+ antiporter
MTVNERLAHFDLLHAFDSAVASRDFAAIFAVLRQAKLTDQQARQTATEVLANPG